MLLNRLEQGSLAFYLLPRFFALTCLWLFLSLFSLESFFYQSAFCNEQLFKLESSELSFSPSFFEYLSSLVVENNTFFPRPSQLLFFVGIVCSLFMFVIGYFRLFAIIIFLALGTVLAQPCIVFSLENNAGIAGEKLLACIAFLMIFYPKDPLGYGVSSWYRYCFMMLLFAIFTGSTFARTESIHWQESSALWHALLDPTISRFSEMFMQAPEKLPESLMVAASFIVFAFEAAFPLLLLFSAFFFRNWLRNIILLFAISLQIINAGLFSTEILSFSIILLLLASFAPKRGAGFMGGGGYEAPNALNTVITR